MIDYNLTKIKALCFDVDGARSCETVPMDAEGQPLRGAARRAGAPAARPSG